MADEMMRVAARGEDGTAKGIQADNDGRLITKTSIKTNFGGVVDRGEKLRTPFMFSEGYLFGRAVVRISGVRHLKISLINISTTGEDEAPLVIFDGDVKETQNIDYEITSDRYVLEFETTTSGGVSIRHNSYNVLHNHAINPKVNTSLKRKVIEEQTTLIGGEKTRTPIRSSEGYLFGRLTVRISDRRIIKVSIVNYDFMGREEEPITIFEGEVKDVVNINYETTAEEYQIELEAVTLSGVAFRPDSYEVLHNININDLQNVNVINPVRRPTKFPKGHLVFKDLPIEVDILEIGTDGLYYVIDKQGVLKKYESITNSAEPVEVGMTWNSQTHGRLVRLIVTDDGCVFFSNYNNGTEVDTRIYRSETINGELSLTYENAEAGVSPIWSHMFGIDHYYNGQTSFFLAGEYGSGTAEGHNKARNLVLSTDGGRSFEVVKKTQGVGIGDANSHWHDAHIDYYHGILWASEGDNQNGGTYYSLDLGETWQTLAKEEQPTAIISYPDKIVFGRDGSRVGFDVLDFPAQIGDLRLGKLKTGQEFKTVPAWRYFAMKPVKAQGETYLNFTLYDISVAPMIVASGDYGETWHGVWLGVGQSDVGNFVAIDNKYVYALKGSKVVYAERLEWE